MSVFDTNTNSTSSAVTATGETGSVMNRDLHQEGSSTGLVNNNTPIVQSDDNKKTIVLDGPLSEIYTRALNLVYGKYAGQDADTISQETQQMDSVLVADAHKFNKAKQDEQDKVEGESAYVYVTDANRLNNFELVEAFDNVRVALDSNQFQKTVLCIESAGNVNNKNVELLATYAIQNGSRVFYDRSIAQRYLSGMYNA